MEKKGVLLGQVIFLIVAILSLVIVVYVIMAQGLGGAVTGQTFIMTCTMSSYSRGAIVMTLTPFLDSIGGAIIGLDVLQGVGTAMDLGGGVLQIAIFAPKGFYEGMDNADAFKYSVLSKIPLACPTITLDVGKKNEKATVNEAYNKIGQSIQDTYNMFTAGIFDPLMGVDPPNPRTAFVLEMHVDEEINLHDAYVWIKDTYPEQSTEWFGSGYSGKIYVYCEEKLGNNPTDFEACSFKDARIYVMYKDEHSLGYVTSGTHVCGTNIQKHAIEYSTEYATDVVIIGRDREDLDDYSPWRQGSDAIVLCVDKM